MGIHCHVSEASEGLEEKRIKNRGGLKGKHYLNAHEQMHTKSLHSIKQGLTIGLTIAKVLELLCLHGGILLLSGGHLEI